MKLLCYDIDTGPRAGVLRPGREDEILDVSALLGSRHTLTDVRALLEQPDDPIERLREKLAAGAPGPGLALSEARHTASAPLPPNSPGPCCGLSLRFSRPFPPPPVGAQPRWAMASKSSCFTVFLIMASSVLKMFLPEAALVSKNGTLSIK